MGRSLQIANCKMQIENWKICVGTRLAPSELSPVETLRDDGTGDRGRSSSSFLNLHFAIRNLQ
jgi:hypothetical protein